LGLRIDDSIGYEKPQQVLDLVKTRQEYRKNGIWEKEDGVSKQVQELGYIVEDLPDGRFKVKRFLQ
jgi:cysteinyl-tRNA synthetase